MASHTKFNILRGQNPILFPYKYCPEISVRNFHSLKCNNTEAGRALKFFCATAVHHLQMRVCVYVCVCVFIKLHITAQPGPVKLIFQCYSNGSALWGISG